MKLGIPKRRLLVYPGAFGLALVIGLLLSFIYERSLGQGRVLRGVVVEGQVLSGLDRQGAEAALARRKTAVESAQLSFVLGADVLALSAKDIGLSCDVKAAVERALLTGRRGSWPVQLGAWVARLFTVVKSDAELIVDEQRLGKKLNPWTAKRLPPPEWPQLTFDKQLEVLPGRGGSVVALAPLKETLTSGAFAQRLTKPGPITITLPVEIKPPPIAPALVERRRKEAEALLSAPIEVRSPDGSQSLALSPKSLGAALSGVAVQGKQDFHLELSIEELRKKLAPILTEIERPALDAAFEFSATAAPKITPSQEGVGLDEAALIQALWAASTAKERRVTLSVTTLAPKFDEAEAKGLGIKGLVMSFVTYHPCCQARVKNIHHAAEILDGTILKPGEKFSLNQLLGQRTRAAGYFEAPAIVNGEMEDVFGGGISQLATTLFNAVLRGGYEIVQRQPHSVYFSRYPEGHEATVSFPEPDLIFRNDTKAGMVIKAQAAPTFIRISVYGDVAGRVTRIKKSKRYKILDPPKEYEPDEEMDPLESKRLRAGQLGWTVLVSRTVKEADGSEKVEKREVVYNPRPELLRVHPCMIPEGEEGHTGAECPEPEIEEREEELSEGEFFETR